MGVVYHVDLSKDGAQFTWRAKTVIFLNLITVDLLGTLQLGLINVLLIRTDIGHSGTTRVNITFTLHTIKNIFTVYTNKGRGSHT